MDFSLQLSEGDKAALERRRQRSNKISKLMGEYLLKGYKMLGSTCNKCDTILMRDRQQNDYCVACNEIDGLPSTSSSSQQQQQPDVTQHGHSETADVSSDRYPVELRLEECSSDHTTQRKPPAPSDATLNPSSHLTQIMSSPEEPKPFSSLGHDKNNCFDFAMKTLAGKIQWASEALERTISIEESLKLCELIKSCCQTLHELKKCRSMTNLKLENLE